MKLIGFTGKMGSGKDQSFRFLEQHLGQFGVVTVRRGFADKLKLSAYRLFHPDVDHVDAEEEIMAALDWSDEFKHEGFVDVAWDAGKGQHLSGRQFLQRYGTESHRDVFGSNFWVDALLPQDDIVYADHIPEEERRQDWWDSFLIGDSEYGSDFRADVAVVTDVRFPNERDRIQELGGKVVKVVRPGTESSDHASEQDLIRCDYTINNRSDLDYLREEVVSMAELPLGRSAHMSYKAEILADSISPLGVRLITLETTFPRFILAEVNTHRMLSRNSASSRAIPTEKIIQRVQKDPFIPETFNKRVKGMGVGEALGDADMLQSAKAWLYARDKSVMAAQVLVDMNVDKSRVNRLLEPFMWHTAIITATEWDNFFALRDHPDAQPEFQILAKLMREAITESSPQPTDVGEWAVPLVGDGVPGDEQDAWVSAGRCARASYDTQHNPESREDSIKRAKTLASKGHISPHEHPATPFDGIYADKEFDGNFRGWTQLRKTIPNEDNFGAILADQQEAA